MKEPRAPRTSMGCPHEGPRVDLALSVAAALLARVLRAHPLACHLCARGCESECVRERVCVGVTVGVRESVCERECVCVCVRESA